MSLKRTLEHISSAQDDAATDNGLMFDPSSPLYPYKFIDTLVEQYARRQNPQAEHPSVVCCPPAYEETFLREPLGDERACVHGDNCEGLKIPCKTPFVLREFLYPGKHEPADNQVRGMCLLCKRFEIAKMFFHFEAQDNDMPPSQVAISKHYNIIGVPGEYCIDDCIVSHGRHTGLIMPVVLHIRSAYVLHIDQGVKHYKQTHLPDPGQPNATCAFLAKGAALQQKEDAARSSSTQAIQ